FHTGKIESARVTPSMETNSIVVFAPRKDLDAIYRMVARLESDGSAAAKAAASPAAKDGGKTEPYRIKPLDDLYVFVPLSDTLPKDPVRGQYPVAPGVLLYLPFRYGMVKVDGMTFEEAANAIAHQLTKHIKNQPPVSVAPAQFARREASLP